MGEEDGGVQWGWDMVSRVKEMKGWVQNRRDEAESEANLQKRVLEQDRREEAGSEAKLHERGWRQSTENASKAVSVRRETPWTTLRGSPRGRVVDWEACDAYNKPQRCHPEGRGFAS